MTATASAARRRIDAAPAADPPFPDEILEEIFLRLGGAADLARAAAACASFRRVATARPFLRRFRSLHAPPVLGFLDIHGFHPAAPPHSSAPAAAALARAAADFTFSYLPEPSRRWSVVDARDGLVLLSRPIAGAGAGAFADLVVCDPLYRRYVLVPPIPDDLAASVPQHMTAGDSSPSWFRPVPPRPARARVPRHPRLPPRRAADFTFSYLPEPSRRWSVVDARDGLVLLSRPIAGAFADLVVCDPLYRRYVLVPPIPDDLAASVPQHDRRRFISFLVPAGDCEKGSPSFSLVCASVDSESKAVAFLFRSGADGNWRGIANSSRLPLPHMLFSWASHRSYAHGCFYWIVGYSTDDSYLLVLDTHEMKLFATIDLPLRPNNGMRAIVETGEEGMLGLLTFDASAIRLFRRTWPKNNASVGAEEEEEWQLYKTAAPLPRNLNGNCYDWYRPSCAAGVYLLVLGRESLRKSRCSWHYYTLDLRTLPLERLCVLDCAVISSSHLYSRFPPPFAPPGI
ncbi:unnamed protein product [Urochloa decumbens]|uniref:F-box domain-containing protein n=1 Tax=Urochloa decumbens TaxID=240449 RepID=A0ABC8VW51_9POAL